MMESPIFTRPSLLLLTKNVSSQPGLDDEGGCSYLPKALIDHGVEEFARLHDLKQEGWNDVTFDGFFEKQRHTADTADSKLEKMWFCLMRRILAEVDKAIPFLPKAGKLRFLDLGFCPGGFTSYVLASNFKAHGVGVSLPINQGGHRCQLPSRASKRMQLIYHDMTNFQLGPSPIVSSEFDPIPDTIGENTFDLALLDGHFLRTQKPVVDWNGDRILVSQIILALRCVVKGGNVVIKLSRPDRMMTAKLLYMFDSISSSLTTHKPLTSHTKRGTFYAVACGLGFGLNGGCVEEILEAFQKLWVELTFGGEEGTGRYLTHGDLDFVVSDGEIVGSYLERLVQLGSPVWEVQRNALARLFSKQKTREA